MSESHRFSNLAEAREALLKLRAASTGSTGGPAKTERGMSLHQALLHCGQSIDYSLTGFPQLKSGIVRATIGPIVAHRFLAKGAMSHDLAAPVPGAPAIPVDGDLQAACDTLLQAIDRFLAHTAPIHPHFVFGTLTKSQFERLHAMHIADHFSAVTS